MSNRRMADFANSNRGNLEEMRRHLWEFLFSLCDVIIFDPNISLHELAAFEIEGGTDLLHHQPRRL